MRIPLKTKCLGVMSQSRKVFLFKTRRHYQGHVEAVVEATGVSIGPQRDNVLDRCVYFQFGHYPLHACFNPRMPSWTFLSTWKFLFRHGHAAVKLAPMKKGGWYLNFNSSETLLDHYCLVTWKGSRKSFISFHCKYFLSVLWHSCVNEHKIGQNEQNFCRTL